MNEFSCLFHNDPETFFIVYKSSRQDFSLAPFLLRIWNSGSKLVSHNHQPISATLTGGSEMVAMQSPQWCRYWRQKSFFLLTTANASLWRDLHGHVQSSPSLGKAKIVIATHFYFAIVKPKVGQNNYFLLFQDVGSLQSVMQPLPTLALAVKKKHSIPDGSLIVAIVLPPCPPPKFEVVSELPELI